MQDPLDTDFWLDDADELRPSLNLANLITATKSTFNHTNAESRLSYHIELLHTLAACVESENETCARKLRPRFPLSLLTTGIKSEELHDRVRAAYMLLCGALYVRPCVSEPGLAREFFLVARKGMQHTPNEEAVQCLAASLESALRLLQRDEPIAALERSKCEHLFPHAGSNHGGAISFVSDLFESSIFETLDEERAPGDASNFA